MFDIHAHILPGLDDGPGTLEDAVHMVRMAAAAGTAGIVATPHYSVRFAFDPDVVRAGLDQLREAAGPAPAIHAGCELHLTADSVEAALAHPASYTIGSRMFLLTELPGFLAARTAGRILKRLLEAGIVPVIAHPERDPLFQGGTEVLSEWCGMGCLVQVTGQSFLGAFGAGARRTAHRLLRSGLVHMIASDAHDTIGRPPRLDAVRRAIASAYGGAAAEILLSTNPRAVVAGSPDAIQTIHPSRKSIFTRLRSTFGGAACGDDLG